MSYLTAISLNIEFMVKHGMTITYNVDVKYDNVFLVSCQAVCRCQAQVQQGNEDNVCKELHIIEETLKTMKNTFTRMHGKHQHRNCDKDVNAVSLCNDM